MELDFDPAVFVDINFFVLGADDGGGLDAADIGFFNISDRAVGDVCGNGGKAVGVVCAAGGLFFEGLGLFACVRDAYEKIFFVEVPEIMISQLKGMAGQQSRAVTLSLGLFPEGDLFFTADSGFFPACLLIAVGAGVVVDFVFADLFVFGLVLGVQGMGRVFEVVAGLAIGSGAQSV